MLNSLPAGRSVRACTQAVLISCLTCASEKVWTGMTGPGGMFAMTACNISVWVSMSVWLEREKYHFG